MPLQPGEVSLLTVFADVHSYFGSPAAKPVHHRFDKKSYVYLYHDVMNKRGRFEVANHPGTADQDAFMGYLDSATIEYSYKQPTLFTVSLDNRGQNGTGSTPSPQNDISQWHLPAFDLRGENKYMYKITTLELYLWTTDDASLLLDSLRRVLHPNQLQILDAPAGLPEHRDSMSPVIQKLEKAAITTPNPYKRSDSISTTHTSHSNHAPMSTHTPVSPPSSTPVGQQAAAFAPMAYNPSAPAAPEPIAHREKTPPPPDAEGGTGLMGAAVNDQGNQFPFPGPPQQAQFTPQQTPYMPGPPSMAPPPSGPGMQRSHTMASISSPASIPPPPQSPYAASFAPPPKAPTPQDPNAHLYAQQPPNPGLQRQATAPGSYSTPYNPSQPQQAAAQNTQYASYPTYAPPTPGQPPTPGFAPLQSPGLYGSQQQHPYGSHDPQSVQHGLHAQVYVPEEGAKPAQAGVGQPGATGKFEQRADKLEKGVSRFLKKLDKKF